MRSFDAESQRDDVYHVVSRNPMTPGLHVGIKISLKFVIVGRAYK